jgi:hypothetical protein
MAQKHFLGLLGHVLCVWWDGRSVPLKFVDTELQGFLNVIYMGVRMQVPLRLL